ncbi:putative serine/threonine-protein kinase [Cedratvirus lausannensis]|uniref:Putative serine/threonine-protein kinase n=1 Tax=Cedratvirus lausannensis TaxID=2023205 RepID=A0A285PXP4_9VIRU|nr:putative serine/threonine-protein kinase [Cedratvirus lausannensis]
MLKFLGEGTYGRVWKVRKEGKDYALKNFSHRRQHIGVPDVSEMALCMILDHPHIIKYHEIVYHKENDQYALLMELADRDLHSHLLKNPNLERAQLYTYFFQLCTAVKYLHQAGIAHYDIKPNNCLLLDNKIKLCDFGASRPFQLSEHDVRPTLCPPEVYGFIKPSLRKPGSIFDQKTYSAAKVDMWSLGETFFFLLTGRHLFSVYTKETCRLQVTFAKDRRAYFASLGDADSCLNEQEISLLLLLLEPDVQKRPDDVSVILQHELFSGMNPCVTSLNLPLFTPSREIMHWLEGMNPCVTSLNLPLFTPSREIMHWLEGMELSDLLVRSTVCFFSLCSKEVVEKKRLLVITCLLLCSKIYSFSLTEEELKDISRNICTLREIYDLERSLFLQFQGRCIFRVAHRTDDTDSQTPLSIDA